jgi:hypothetical protein
LLVSTSPVTSLDLPLNLADSLHGFQLSFIKEHAEAVMKASPVDYVKNAKIYGSLFNFQNDANIVSCVDTGFFVDHAEPLQALKRVRDEYMWPLGELLDGHEFLVILEAKIRGHQHLAG